MIKIRNLLAVGITTYIAGVATLAFTSDASAAFRRGHSSSCHYAYDNVGTSLYNGSYLRDDTSNRSIYCPVNSDTELTHNGTTLLNVHGYVQAQNTSYAETCSKAYAAAGATCSSLRYFDSPYGGALNVPLTGWADGGAFPYIFVYLRANDRLFGYWMTN